MEEEAKLKSGVYVCKPDGAYGEVVIKAKETDKSYVFELVDNTCRYSPGHIDMLFGKSGRAVIARNKPSPHSMAYKEDDWFVIYPYRAGIPFLFELAG